MVIDLRLPNITGPSDHERLVQMQSYLHQFVEQLQWALQNVDTSHAEVVNPTPRSLMPSGAYGVMPVSDGDDPQSTFNSIKSLIIKSADIVEAYYEEINRRLESVYVAQSDFGAYSQYISDAIEETSTGVSHAFDNIQTIAESLKTHKTDLNTLNVEIEGVDSALKDAKSSIDTDLKGVRDAIDALNYSIIAVTANTKTGLLFYDDNGVPVYGFEIGQKNVIDGVEVFNKFARFTAGRLSFYDQNGTEVAYISDYKLYITHAEVTGTLKLGGYLVDTTKGLTFKWVGRS